MTGSQLRPAFLVGLFLALLATALEGVQSEELEVLSEDLCRPYIEKALKDLGTGSLEQTSAEIGIDVDKESHEEDSTPASDEAGEATNDVSTEDLAADEENQEAIEEEGTEADAASTEDAEDESEKGSAEVDQSAEDAGDHSAEASEAAEEEGEEKEESAEGDAGTEEEKDDSHETVEGEDAEDSGQEQDDEEKDQKSDEDAQVEDGQSDEQDEKTEEASDEEAKTNEEKSDEEEGQADDVKSAEEEGEGTEEEQDETGEDETADSKAEEEEGASKEETQEEEGASKEETQEEEGASKEETEEEGQEASPEEDAETDDDSKAEEGGSQEDAQVSGEEANADSQEEGQGESAEEQADEGEKESGEEGDAAASTEDAEEEGKSGEEAADEAEQSVEEEEAKSGDDEETKSGEDEETKSGEDEEAKSGEDEEAKSGEDEEAKSGEEEETKSGEEEEGKSAEQEEGKSAEQEGKSAEEDEEAKSGEGESEAVEDGKSAEEEADADADAAKSGEDEGAASTEAEEPKSEEEDTEEVKSRAKRGADEQEDGSDAEEESAGSEEGDESEEEPTPEEDLIQEIEVPENLRPREHIKQLLKLDEENEEKEKSIEKIGDIVLRDLKKLYDNAIQPLETLYKYRDLSNRHFGDPEIFSKPLVLFMGPWSGGKSSIINYLLDNEYKHTSLRTGAEPSPAYFNILMHGEEAEILDGTQLAADWTFSGLQKFGQGLLDRLRGLRLNSKLLEKVNIVEIPGILEIRKQVQRLFPFNDACQWFIDRADIIFLVYDPSKLDVGPETEAILDQLKGREYQTRIILNKADQVKPEELMRVQGALIWNISPLMSSAEPPIMYSTSLWSLPYEAGAPTRLLYAQERAFLRDLRGAIDKRVEHKIASARRFAVRVRNHAKMVDCYLTTYYNHKSFFGNKKEISDKIIENPQEYHIYEGLSTLTNISRYDLPDPDVYRDFFRLNPLYDFQQLSSTCTYFRGCPINRLDVAIAYDLPELVGKYRKSVEQVTHEYETNSPPS